MKKSSFLLLGYDFDQWNEFGRKEPILTDLSTKTNSHILVCGMSGSGKSYDVIFLLVNIIKAENEDAKVYFADYKQEEEFSFLRSCSHYYPFQSAVEALEIVYKTLQKRQSGEDLSRSQITLIWDEYFGNILSLQNHDKKNAEIIMRKISEILMMGRSLGVRLVISCQRPDAIVFPMGSRLNFGIVIILGASIGSIYDMLLPREYIDEIGNRAFGIGEGVVLLQGSQLRMIKIPMVKNLEKMKHICIGTLIKEY